MEGFRRAGLICIYTHGTQNHRLYMPYGYETRKRHRPHAGFAPLTRQLKTSINGQACYMVFMILKT